MKGVTLPTETVFVMEMSPIKFGLGATEEIGFDARRLGLRKVLIVTDPGLAALGLPERVRALLDEQGVKADVFDGVAVEPTDRSMEEAAEYARTKEVDGFVAVGGGSAIDTGKAVNLLTCYPAPGLQDDRVVPGSQELPGRDQPRHARADYHHPLRRPLAPRQAMPRRFEQRLVPLRSDPHPALPAPRAVAAL